MGTTARTCVVVRSVDGLLVSSKGILVIHRGIRRHRVQTNHGGFVLGLAFENRYGDSPWETGLGSASWRTRASERRKQRNASSGRQRSDDRRRAKPLSRARFPLRKRRLLVPPPREAEVIELSPTGLRRMHLGTNGFATVGMAFRRKQGWVRSWVSSWWQALPCTNT